LCVPELRRDHDIDLRRLDDKGLTECRAIQRSQQAQNNQNEPLYLQTHNNVQTGWNSSLPVELAIKPGDKQRAISSGAETIASCFRAASRTPEESTWSAFPFCS